MDRLLAAIPFLIVAAAFVAGAILIPSGSFSDLRMQSGAGPRSAGCASPLPGPDAWGHGTGCGSHF